MDIRKEAKPQPAPILLTVSVAAALLSIGRSTMYQLIAAGEIEVVHIGRSCRIRVTELEAYLERISARPSRPVVTAGS